MVRTPLGMQICSCKSESCQSLALLAPQGVPPIYTARVHKAALRRALQLLSGWTRGPAKEKAASLLQEACERIWRSPPTEDIAIVGGAAHRGHRMQCESVSVTGRQCVLPAGHEEGEAGMPHRSTATLLRAIASGARQEVSNCGHSIFITGNAVDYNAFSDPTCSPFQTPSLCMGPTISDSNPARILGGSGMSLLQPLSREKERVLNSIMACSLRGMQYEWYQWLVSGGGQLNFPGVSHGRHHL